MFCGQFYEKWVKLHLKESLSVKRDKPALNAGICPCNCNQFLSSFDSNSLKRWLPNLGVPCSKPLGGSKGDLAFHPSEVNQVTTKNFWELSGKK